MAKLIKPITLIASILLCFGVNSQSRICAEPPVISCSDVVYVSLNPKGETLVSFIMLLDNDAYDKCTPSDKLEYRIVIPSTGKDYDTPPNGAMDDWLLDCDDLGSTTADIWVGDEHGN